MVSLYSRSSHIARVDGVESLEPHDFGSEHKTGRTLPLLADRTPLPVGPRLKLQLITVVPGHRSVCVFILDVRNLPRSHQAASR